MRLLLTVFITTSFFYNFYAQNEITGKYSVKTNSENLKFKLTLNQNATFDFEYYQYNKMATPKTTHLFGRGSWYENDCKVYFNTKPEDLNDKYTLDFTGTEARFVAPHPRNLGINKIKTHLVFYKSGIFWMDHVKYFKM